MKFRKRPVVIDAIRWTGTLDSAESIRDAFGQDICVEAMPGQHGDEPAGLSCQTLEGYLCATEGDWIVRGIENEVYPVKPSIFEKTYEPVQDKEKETPCPST